MCGRRSAAIGLSLAVGSILSAQQPPQQTGNPPTFRTGVTVVPVDIRVVDRNGRPVTDLKQFDFTITEDGVPQRIVHFSFRTLTPSAEPAGDRPLDLRKPLGNTVTPQTRRIFLIVLGRGRQVGPVKGVEAAVRFVKERLLPQDQLAIMAYNRSTDFTTDHKKVVETLDRYRKKHEGIDARLRHHFSGLAAAYSDGQIPPAIQTEIDAVFHAPGALTSRTVIDTRVTDASRIADDTRRNRDLIQRAEIAADRQQAGLGTAFDQSAIDEAELAGMSGIGFDEYVEKSFDTNSDLGNLYARIRYLRWLDGEKHLVFVTPRGLFLPRLENANSIASLANDARVTVDVIHTYGVETAPMMMTSRAGAGPPPTRASFVQMFQIDAVAVCVDRRQGMVGEIWHTIDIKLSEQNYQRLMGEGISFNARIPLKGDPKYVKVIIYDHTADSIGSATLELGQKR